MPKDYNYLRIDGREYDIRRMTRDELMRLKLRIDDATTDIDAQIDEAKAQVKATGEYADPQWFVKVKHARAMLGRHSQRIQHRIREIKEQERVEAAQRWERAFVDAARRKLSKRDYLSLLDAANAETGQRRTG